jgi:hypothetical protein
MNDTRATPSIALHACVGFVVGFLAEYIYLNVHTIERLASETDGFAAWSVFQIPFALPGGIAGAALGAAVAVLRRMLPAKRRDGTPPGTAPRE